MTTAPLTEEQVARLKRIYHPWHDHPPLTWPALTFEPTPWVLWRTIHARSTRIKLVVNADYDAKAPVRDLVHIARVTNDGLRADYLAHMSEERNR